MTEAKLEPHVVAKAKPPRGTTASGSPVKQRTLKDGKNGLELRVSRSGKKTWSVRYRVRGQDRHRRMTIGTYTGKKGGMSLAEARERASQIAGDASKGQDPVADRDAERRALKAQRERAKTGSFKALAARYLDEYALGDEIGPRCRKPRRSRKAQCPHGLTWGHLLDANGEPADVWTYSVIEGTPAKRSWTEDRRKLEVEVIPLWGDRPAHEITRPDVRSLLQGIAQRGAPTQANRTRALLHKLFNWAIECDTEQETFDANPVSRTARPGGSEKNRGRERVLTTDELRAFWKATEPGSDELMTAAMSAFWRLRLITAQRASEVVAMRWQDIDEEGIWTIPGSVTKNKRSHRVPLPEAAIDILRDLQQHDERVCAGALGNRQRSNAAKLIHACIDDFRGHDLRRTAATLMAASGVDRLHVAKVLNHTSETERGATPIYDRHGYEAEKRAALETWASKLRAILERENGATVVPFARAEA